MTKKLSIDTVALQRRHLLVGAAGIAAFGPGIARAAGFPERPVTIVVPFAAGGTTDVASRKLAESLRKRWNQNVVVVNKPGAGTIIAVEQVARSAPDGYTLLIAPDPTYSVNPLVFAKLPYDPVKDLAPVMTMVTYPLGIAVNTSLGVNNLKELVELSKTRQLNYGSFGVGTAPQLVMELFKAQSGLRMQHVPYNGIAPVLLAMNAGDVHATVLGAGAAVPGVKGGKLKLLAMDTRAALFPEIPTFAELGYPKMQAPAWWGVAAAAGTPQPIINQIYADISAAMKEPEMASYLQIAGYDPAFEGPAVFAKRMRDTRDLWEPVVRANKITLE